MYCYCYQGCPKFDMTKTDRSVISFVFLVLSRHNISIVKRRLKHQQKDHKTITLIDHKKMTMLPLQLLQKAAHMWSVFSSFPWISYLWRKIYTHKALTPLQWNHLDSSIYQICKQLPKIDMGPYCENLTRDFMRQNRKIHGITILFQLPVGLFHGWLYTFVMKWQKNPKISRYTYLCTYLPEKIWNYKSLKLKICQITKL